MSTTPDKLVFYYIAGGNLNYLVFENGDWTDKSVVLTEAVNADAAVAALRRMVSGD